MKWSIFMLFVCLLFSCIKQSNTPLDLTKEQTLDLLYDIELAKESVRSVNNFEKDSLFTLYIGAIAERYSLTSEEIHNQIDWLLDNESEQMRIHLDSLKLRFGAKKKIMISKNLK